MKQNNKPSCVAKKIMKPVPIGSAFGNVSSLHRWLCQQAHGQACWLLAHADNGVIWGRMSQGNSELVLSHNAFPDLSVPLLPTTLQELRLFGAGRELLLWRDGVEWRARLIYDETGQGVQTWDESYLLWGRDVKNIKNGFSHLVQGAEGLEHAIPMQIRIDGKTSGHIPDDKSIALRVRHYVDYDEDGQAYIFTSRLVDLEVKDSKEK